MQLTQLRKARNRVRALREAMGLTQQQLAVAADIPTPTIARLDAHPTARPSIGTALKLASRLGIEPRDLFTQE